MSETNTSNPAPDSDPAERDELDDEIQVEDAATSTPWQVPRKSLIVLVLVLAAGPLLLMFGPVINHLPFGSSHYRGGSPLRDGCRHNLKQIIFALHNYHDTFGSFPPAFVADANGVPIHSWRVLILPYFNEPETLSVTQRLYDSYDFTKPWDASENRFVLEHMPDVFRCPRHHDVDPNATSYAGVFGTGCMFDPAKPIRIREVKDGTTNTLFVGEIVDVDLPWTMPGDIDVLKYRRLNEAHGFSASRRRLFVWTWRRCGSSDQRQITGRNAAVPLPATRRA